MEKYLEIGKYITLLSRFLLYGVKPTVERLNTGTNCKELIKTQSKYDDHRLKNSGVKAINRVRDAKNSVLFAKYEDNDFYIFPLLDLDKENPAENHLGIHIKGTNENIIYSIFIDDEIFESFYRSDEHFHMLRFIGSQKRE